MVMLCMQTWEKEFVNLQYKYLSLFKMEIKGLCLCLV